MSDEPLKYDKRKTSELYKQIMNVLDRNNATTEEGFISMVTGLKTIVENPLLTIWDRRELKKRIVDAMQAELVPGGPQIITPGMTN